MARQTTMRYFFPLPSDADRLLESVDLDQEDVDRQEVAHLVFASSHSGFMKSLQVSDSALEPAPKSPKVKEKRTFKAEWRDMYLMDFLHPMMTCMICWQTFDCSSRVVTLTRLYILTRISLIQ